MSEYLHGAYGDTQADGNRTAENSGQAIVCIGTAPVHNLALASGESYPVNKPVLVHNIAEAKKYFGYSDDWASYTLCEAMHHFFETKGIGPLVLINVLDPTKAAHKSQNATTVSKTPVNNVITVTGAENIILESVVVQTIVEQGDPVVKVKGTDYTIAYNAAKKTIVITGITSLGTDPLNIVYYTINPAGVTSNDVIGTTDGLGTNTGLYAVKNVYMLTGVIPAYLIAPGFSSVPAVHNIMAQVTRKVNGHWDMYMFVDMPLMDNTTPLTMDTAATWKDTNAYNRENETVYFPMASGADGRKYHIATLAAANFLELLGENDGIPYHSASNTDAPVIVNLYMGDANAGKVFDDEIINEKLNKNGIASAAYVGKRWAIWGAHSADYNQENADYVNVAETNRMMLYYLSNDFQARRPRDVDKPMTRNDIDSIRAEEQARLDALKTIGALIYGEALISADDVPDSDVYSGDYAFEFRVTTTPLAKSLRAIVTWVDDGFATYFAETA